VLQCKDSKQPLKWDTFIGRKGGMNNILPPVKITPSSSSNSQSKLDSIHDGKQDEKPKLEARPPPLKPDQYRPIRTELRPPSPKLGVHQPEFQPPTPKSDHHADVKTEDNKIKNLLKGKPIIFIGGGPGIKRSYFVRKFISFLFNRQW
jgi:hypothetical protein